MSRNQHISALYADREGLDVDKDGQPAHTDVPSTGKGKGKLVDLENVGVPTGDDQPDAEELAPTGAPEANPEVDGASDPVTGEVVEEGLTNSKAEGDE